MKYICFLITLCLILLVSIQTIYADFVPPNKPSFEVSSGGDIAHQHWTLTGITPFLNGYAGIQWIYSATDTDPISNHIKARVEVSKHWNLIGVYAYGRYGKRSVMFQDKILQVGLSFDLKIVDSANTSINAGFGSYVEHETLEEEYQAVLENTSVKFAPRGHIDLNWKKISLRNEFLLDPDFKRYRIRSFPQIEIPVTRVLFLDRVSLIISGSIVYDSKTRHIDIDPFQWHWAHALRWTF